MERRSRALSNEPLSSPILLETWPPRGLGRLHDSIFHVLEWGGNDEKEVSRWSETRAQ